MLIRFWRDRRGSVLALMTLLIPALVGIAGLATEGGFLLYKKRALQGAADTAAFSAANAFAIVPTSDLTLQAKAVAADSGFVSGVNGTTVTVNKPPVGTCFSGTSNYVGDPRGIEAIVTETLPRIFSRMFFASSTVDICARSVAIVSGGGDCLLSLGPTGTGISSSNNNLNLNLEGCSLASNSSDSNAISITGNSDSITAETISAVGGIAMNGNSLTTSVTGTTGNPPVADPYKTAAAGWPSTCGGCQTYISVTEPPNGSPKVATLLPGNWPNGITLNTTGATYNMAAGIYYLGGDLNFNRGNVILNGPGVTLILTGNSRINAGSQNSTMNLSAPTSGPLQGDVEWEPTSTGTNNFGGNSFTANLKGIIYTPNAVVNYAGNTGTTALPSCVQIVAKSILLGGNSINISGNCSSVPGFKKFGQLVALVE